MVTKKKTTKKRTKRKIAGRKAPRKKIPGWVLLMAGVVFGLLIAGFGYFNGWVPKPSNPNSVIEAQNNSPLHKNEEDKSEELKIERKKDYDFYDTLQDMEVQIDDKAIERAHNRVPKNYILQLGSFKNLNDAETMKAKIAFSGMMAHIQEVEVNNTTWHRVVLGPFKGSRKADVMKRKLEKIGFDSIIINDK